MEMEVINIIILANRFLINICEIISKSDIQKESSHSHSYKDANVKYLLRSVLHRRIRVPWCYWETDNHRVDQQQQPINNVRGNETTKSGTKKYKNVSNTHDLILDKSVALSRERSRDHICSLSNSSRPTIIIMSNCNWCTLRTPSQRKSRKTETDDDQ